MTGAQRNGRSRQHNSPPYRRPSESVTPDRELTPPGRGTGDIHALDSDRSPLPTDARQLTRMVAMFWNARAVLNAGNELRRALDEGSEQAVRDAASQAQKLNFALYDELDQLQPDLFDLLATEGNHFMRNVRDKLNEGRSGAKAEDNHKVKHAIVHLKKWEPSLIDEPKDKRGLLHPECAYLLSPITVDWDNEGQKQQFLEGKPPMVASHWPRFVYPDGKGNTTRPSEGLLQNQLLVDVAKVVLQSPSSVIPSATVRPGTVRRGRKGIGAKYQLTQVTPAFLAYIAVLVHFALSSEDSFSDEGGTFNYVDFYSQLRTFLEAPKFRACTKVLLEWWNKKLFPDAIRGADGGVGPGNYPDGMLALLEAEFDDDNEGDDGDEASET